jgi:ankyrin repeat protein
MELIFVCFLFFEGEIYLFILLLLLACQNPSSSMTAQQLLRYGANARAVDSLGNTALHLAADPSLVKALISSGASVDASNQAGLTPLHLAVRHTTSRNEIVSLLAEAGCQLDQPTPLGIYVHFLSMMMMISRAREISFFKVNTKI